MAELLRYVYCGANPKGRAEASKNAPNVFLVIFFENQVRCPSLKVKKEPPRQIRPLAKKPEEFSRVFPEMPECRKAQANEILTQKMLAICILEY